MTVRFFRLHEVSDYLQLGWLPSDALYGTHHGEWSVLCVWMCGCKAREPA